MLRKGPRRACGHASPLFRKSHPLPLERSEMHFAMGYKRNFGPNLIQLPVSSPSDPPYRGTSLIRKCTHPGPYRRPRPRILAGS